MRPGRILAIDDEPRVREEVAGYLTREGFRVSEAGDAVTAGKADGGRIETESGPGGRVAVHLPAAQV